MNKFKGLQNFDSKSYLVFEQGQNPIRQNVFAQVNEQGQLNIVLLCVSYS